MPSIVRVGLLALLMVLLAAAALTLAPHDPVALRALIVGVGAAAPLVAVGAWIVLTPALFPGTVLAAAGGLAFGAPVGVAVSWLGAVLGGLAAFALARGAGRGPAERLVGARLARVRRSVERRGFATILLARLTPGVPATALHYAAGLSRVRARHFGAAMAVGSTLRTAPYAVLGAGLGSGSLLGVGSAATSVVLGALLAGLLALHLRRSSSLSAA